jgi:secreted trypsin-like serine protease
MMKFLVLTLLCLSAVSALSFLRKLPNSKPGARIVGGQQASPGQFPWQAAIYKYTADGRYFCGGTLFNEQWILTAGQCVIDATEFTIQLGSNQLDSTDNNRVVLNATTYYVHPSFDPTVSLRFDIGMIKLSSPVTLTDYIQPVRMLESMSPIYKGVSVETAGWGQTSDNGDLVNDLNYVQLKIIANAECKTYYGNQFWGTMTCTEGSNYNEGFCFGDVGGALLADVPVGDYKIQVGISSFISQNGCESLDPTGYTRVDGHYSWIVDTIRNNSIV